MKNWDICKQCETTHDANRQNAIYFPFVNEWIPESGWCFYSPHGFLAYELLEWNDCSYCRLALEHFMVEVSDETLGHLQPVRNDL